MRLDANATVAVRRAPKDVAQTLAVATIALVPLIPRPTFGGYVSVVAPLIAVGAVYFTGLHILASRYAKLVPVVPLFLVVLSTSLYGIRVVWDSEWDELPYFGSRVLFILTIAACCIAFRSDAFEPGLRWFIYGTLVLAALTLVVGVTGLSILEPARPGRLLGIQIPFFKTAGVPRSFGEQGIILAVMLGYFLEYRASMGRLMRWALGLACVVVIVMAQSRNVLLGAVAVPVMWLAVSRGRWVLVRIGLVAAGLATFIVDQIIPVLEDNLIGRSIIGKGIFQQNVESRFTLVQGALSMIANDPARSLIGWSHSDWIAESPVIPDVGVHNNFVSAIMFLGIIGGPLTILGLYFLPLRRIVSIVERIDKLSLEARRRRFAITSATGALVSVNFYEGFFSLALALQIGILWLLMASNEKDPQQSVNWQGSRDAPAVGTEGNELQGALR